MSIAHENQRKPLAQGACRWYDRLMDMESQWNEISRYLTEEELHEDACHLYGPWAPSEAKLELLGDIRDLDVLEIGCGVGQCSIALAQQGARVTGLDVSAAQLAEARARAAEVGADVRWLHGAVERLAALDEASFDLLLANYSLHYVNKLTEAFESFAWILRPGGRLVFALDHPLRASFYDEADVELVPYPTRSYFDNRPMRWRYPGAEVALVSHHLTIAQWLDLGLSNDLNLVRLVEPPPPQDLLDELWPEDDPRAPLRNLPQAIIFVMGK